MADEAAAAVATLDVKSPAEAAPAADGAAAPAAAAKPPKEKKEKTAKQPKPQKEKQQGRCTPGACRVQGGVSGWAQATEREKAMVQS
jgi:hypothetical protein